MSGRRLAGVVCALLAALACEGCGSGLSGPKDYRPPALVNAQGAVIRGSHGVYVMWVDNQRVGGGTGLRTGMGGNEVLLTPGRHRVDVQRAAAAFPLSLSLSLTNKATFEHTFAAGHSYAADYTIGFEMEDETTGQRIEPLP